MEVISTSSSPDYLTPFLIVEYLKSLKMPPDVISALTNELSNKGCFKPLVSLEESNKKSRYEDIAAQVGPVSGLNLEKMMYQSTILAIKKSSLAKEKQQFANKIREKYKDYIKNPAKIVNCIFRDRTKKMSKKIEDYFNKMIFTDDWIKFKTFFGHKKIEIDPDDNIITSPVYNILYEKSGKYIITGGNDGLIKFWSSIDGRLFDSIRAHKEEINAMDISECGRFLASCSNDLSVNIWDLVERRPIAVFRDHKTPACALAFYLEDYKDKYGVSRRRCYFASVSEDGILNLYAEEDFINNGGMLMNPQKRVVITLGGRSSDKGFSCIDFHSDGYIAAGTTTGDLYIWNKNKDKELTDERNRIIYDEHRKDCHLTIWNEEGTMLLTASFDGSAKIWGWDASNFAKNRGAKSIDTIKAGFEKKKNEPAGEVRCSAAAWSCKGRYAIACFSKTINPETNDVKVLSNLQVYDTFLKTRTQKIERIYDNTELENYIFIIEVHPFNESIIFTADHDGKLIVWDIDIGVPLNCFVETCDHIGYPLSNASILDGRFSPDGLSFAITTSMGSFSIYGYGDRGLFVPIPCEQFFEKEYDEFEVEEVTHRILDPATNEELHLINKGPICNYSGTAYNPNIVEKDCNKTAEELYYEKYKSSEQKEKDKYKQNAYSKECIASIPRIVNGLIKKDIEYYTKKLLSKYEGKFPFSELRLDAKQFFMRDTQERQHSFHTPAIANGLQQRSRSNQIQAAIPVQHEDIRMELEQLPEELPAARNTQEEAHKETRQENENQEAHATEEITNVRYGTRFGSRRGLRIDENDDEEGGAQQIYNTRRRETGGRRQKMILDDMDDDDNYQFDEEFKIDPIHDKKPQKSFIRPTKSSKLKPGSSLLMDIEPQCPQESIDNSAKQNEDDEGEQKTTHARMRRKYRPEPPSNLNNTEEITFPEDGHRNTRRIATLNERENTAFNRLINLATSGEVGACSRCKEENARVKCETCSNLYHQRCAKYRGSLVATSIIRRGFQCFECQNKKSKKDLMPYVNISRSWASSEIKQDYVYSPQPGDKVCFIFQAYEEFIAKFFANLDFENPEDIFSYEKVASLQLENSCEVVEVKYHFPVYNKKSKHFEIHNLLCLVVLKTLSDVSGETFKVWYFPVEGNDSLQFLIPKKKFDQGLAAFSKLRLNSEMELSHDGELSKFIIYEVATREAEFYSSRNIYHKTIKIIELKESADKLRLTSLEDLDNMIQTISPWDLMNHIPLPEFLEKENGLTTASLGRLEYDIQKYYDENSNDFEPFYEEVDKTAYPEYQAIIPLEMNLNFLLKRLKNDYYRSKEAIISDAALIGQNAAIFNVSGSEIALSGAQLSENIAHLVRGEPDKILARTNTMQSEETGVQYRVQNSIEQAEENQGGDQKGTIVRLYRQPIDAIDNDDSLQYQGESKDNGRNRDDLKIQISLQPDFMKRRPTRSSRAVNYKEESQVDHLNKQTALGNQPAERKTGIVRTRSGREISSNNALRQTRGGITNHPSQTRNSRLAPSSREAVTNTKSIDNDADERVYTGRLRARKAGSRIKEYDSDDNADNDYLIELEKQSTDRKKVKPEPIHGTEQRPEESLRMNDSDTRGSGSNQEIESTGVRTRKSLRSNTLRAQEQAAVQTQSEQVETNPLEQNFSGVRTRSRLTRGTTPK